MVDSVVEKAQGVLQTTNNPDVAFLIKDISSRYEHIARTAKVKQNGVHLVVHDFQKFKYFPAQTQEITVSMLFAHTFVKDNVKYM